MFTVFNFQISQYSLPWDFGCKTCLEIASQKAFFLFLFSLELQYRWEPSGALIFSN